MLSESAFKPRDGTAPAGNEFAEGLMLVRASTLKMIRLQLAMERQDRRVALEAVDDLVALDRRLQDYLGEAPSSNAQLMFRNALDAERALLDREKLTLGAGVVRRPAELLVEPEPDADWLGPRDLPEPEQPRRNRWWLAALPVAASGAAAVAYLLSAPGAAAWLAELAGAVR